MQASHPTLLYEALASVSAVGLGVALMISQYRRRVVSPSGWGVLALGLGRAWLGSLVIAPAVEGSVAAEALVPSWMMPIDAVVLILAASVALVVLARQRPPDPIRTQTRAA